MHNVIIKPHTKLHFTEHTIENLRLETFIITDHYCWFSCVDVNIITRAAALFRAQPRAG